MKKNKVTLNLLSSFNSSNFANLLKNSNDFDWEIHEADYSQIFQTLSNKNSKMWRTKSNITLIWSTPESISPEFNKLLENKEIDSDMIKQDVFHFFSCVKLIQNNTDLVILPSWILREPYEGSIALSYSKNLGVEYNLSLMNHYLSELINKEKNFYLVNSSKWLSNCGAINTYNSKLWYLMKNPFSNDFFKEAITDITFLYKSLKGLSKKLLILDLDNTLWGGIVGDDGWKNLRIGGHDHLGEAFKDFQNKIKSLKKSGILLALCSKNTESVAIEAIQKHPEMVLSMDDFVNFRINWDDKAKNIADMTKELNLGLQSVVFLDDSPFERARVKEMLPEVVVPDLPINPEEYPNFLSKLHYFDSAYISEEDKKRAELYKSEFKREKLKQEFKSVSQWVETLELKVTIENIKNENLPRAIQLLNKTNQLNLSTRRLTEKEFTNWIKISSNKLWTIRAKDKFGDYGIIGILSLSTKMKVAQLIDFILSCRVIGRNIEEVMIEFIKEFCRKNKIQKINGKYIKTKKNIPLFEFLRKLNLVSSKNYSFEINSNQDDLNLTNIEIIKPFSKN